jgi:hypothetical protein
MYQCTHDTFPAIPRNGGGPHSTYDYGKSIANAVFLADTCSEAFTVHLEGLNEYVPHKRDEMTQTLKAMIENFIIMIENDQNIKAILLKYEFYQQLLLKKKALQERERAEKVLEYQAEQVECRHNKRPRRGP